MSHYHLSRHNEDDDPYISADLYAVLDYAADELDRLADSEHGYVSDVAGRVKDGYRGTLANSKVSESEMQDALLSFGKIETWTALVANGRNMARQHTAKRAARAPVYRPSWQDQGTEESDARLLHSAKNVLEAFQADSPFDVWECEADLHTWPDEDPMHAGEDYCAYEYPDGYAGYQDGPCGDH